MKRRIRRGDPRRQSYWEQVVRRWKDSGRSVRDYCQAEGLRESAFYFWRRKLELRGLATEAVSKPRRKVARVAAVAALPEQQPSPPTRFAGAPGMPSFLPVRVVQDSAVSVARGVEIVLAHGGMVRVSPGFDRQTLTDVLAVLEVRPC
jgi:transposase-like protein